MSAKIEDNKLTLEASGTGYQSAVGQFRFQAPGSTDRMDIFFRAYFDSYTQNESANYGWSNPSAFGLSFTGAIPWPNDHSNFFGLSSATSGGDTVSMVYASDAFGAGNPGVAFGARATTATYIGSSATQPTAGFATDIAPRGPWDLPANPTVGEMFTGIWSIRKVQNTSNLWISTGYNLESLDLDDLRYALDSEQTVWYKKNDSKPETTNWRPTLQTAKFPDYLVFSLPSGIPGVKLVVERIAVDWHSYNQLVLSTG